MLSQEYLKRLFEYDPETGLFCNRSSRGRARAGHEAGSYTCGYWRIVIDGEKYYAHHLAWLYVYGEWPLEIDHRDGDRSNNKIANLRIATRTENCFNADREAGSSGLKGAYLDTRVSKWYSKIQIGYRTIWLGHFSTPEEANRAYLMAAEKYQGEFAYSRRSQP
jgi:hypothetical protein